MEKSATIHLAMGDLQLEMNDLSGALCSYHLALHIFDRDNDVHGQISSLKCLWLCHIMQRRYETSKYMLESALELADDECSKRDVIELLHAQQAFEAEVAQSPALIIDSLN